MGKGRLQFEDSTNKRELTPSLQMYLGTSDSTEGCFLWQRPKFRSASIWNRDGEIGPGKITLLEAIRETGSITAAAVAMKCPIAERGY
jgi:hypothetical protein